MASRAKTNEIKGGLLRLSKNIELCLISNQFIAELNISENDLEQLLCDVENITQKIRKL